MLIIEATDQANALPTKACCFVNKSIDALSLIGRQFTNIPTPTKDREKNANIDFFLKEQGGVVKTTIGLDTMFNDQGSSDVLNMARRRY